MSWVGDFSILFLLIDFKIAAKFAHDAYFFLVQSRDLNSNLPPNLTANEYRANRRTFMTQSLGFFLCGRRLKTEDSSG